MYKKYKRRNHKVVDVIDTEPSYYNNSEYKLKIDVSTIKNAGDGIFALESITKNKLIGYYEGDVMFHINCGSYYISINDEHGINAICYPRCYMAMINDTYKTDYKYNCEFIINESNNDHNKKVEIWSISDININEELFINYGNYYWI